MKKIFKIITFCILVTSLLCSCAKAEPSATDLLFDALETIKEPPAYEIYYSEAPEYSKSVMDENKAELLYRDPLMTSYAESFACALGEDDAIWEIHVFVALSVGDAGFIENALERRLDMLQNREIYIYDPEIYEKRIEDAKVFRRGKVVCMVVCDDNSLVLGEINK